MTFDLAEEIVMSLVTSSLTIPPPPKRPRLEKLEALRGFAAVYVFLAHAQPHPWLVWPLAFAQQAVMLFFILSGFVIYYSTFAGGRHFSTREYLVRRVRRIYPIFLISIPWTYFNIAIAHRRWIGINWKELVGNLLMLQDWSQVKPGVWVNTFLNNNPLWSLSYEWWFYIMFIPVILFVPDRLRRQIVFWISLVGAISYQLLPNQISLFVGYFFLWWTGVEMAREFIRHHKVTFREQWQMLLLLTVLTCVWAFPCIMIKLHGGKISTLTHPLVETTHFLSVLLLLLGGITWHRMRFIGFSWTFQGFAILAPVSYALYIFHVPVVIYARYFDFIHNSIVRTLLYFIALLPFCYLTEVLMQRWINRVTDRWMRRSAIITPAN